MINAQLFLMFIRRNIILTMSASLGVGLVAYLLVVLFPGMDLKAASVIAATWPPMMKSLFGDPAQAFSDVYGWLNLEIYHLMFWAVFGFVAAILASRIIAREREEKTLEILLSYPVSRAAVVVSRFLALTILLVLAVVPCVISLGLGIVTLGLQLKAGPLLFASLSGLLLALFCAAFSLLISVVSVSQLLSTLISLSVTFFMFLFTVELINLVPSLATVAFISPFHAYHVDEVLLQGSYSLSILLLPVYVAVPGAAAVFIFVKRDIML